MKRIAFNDNVEVSYSLSKVVHYLLTNEITHFIESECPSNHIFVDAILIGQLGMANSGSNCLKIHELTESLINEFNEESANELSSLVNKLNDYEDIINDFD